MSLDAPRDGVGKSVGELDPGAAKTEIRRERNNDYPPMKNFK